MVTLVLLEGIIGLVGLAVGPGERPLRPDAAGGERRPGRGARVPAGEALSAGGSARPRSRSGHAGQWVGLVFGLVGALVTGTLLMGQVERACNRLYGVETDRPTKEKYLQAFLLAVTAGAAITGAFVLLAFGRALANSTESPTMETAWTVLRWPVALGLLVAAMALLFRWAPRPRQPAWSWLAYGATISVIGVALASIGLGLLPLELVVR